MRSLVLRRGGATQPATIMAAEYPNPYQLVRSGPAASRDLILLAASLNELLGMSRSILAAYIRMLLREVLRLLGSSPPSGCQGVAFKSLNAGQGRSVSGERFGFAVALHMHPCSN